MAYQHLFWLGVVWMWCFAAILGSSRNSTKNPGTECCISSCFSHFSSVPTWRSSRNLLPQQLWATVVLATSFSVRRTWDAETAGMIFRTTTWSNSEVKKWYRNWYQFSGNLSLVILLKGIWIEVSVVINLVEGGLEVMNADIEDAAAAAACVFETFGGVEGYTAYLRNEVKHLGSKKHGRWEENLFKRGWWNTNALVWTMFNLLNELWCRIREHWQKVWKRYD